MAKDGDRPQLTVIQGGLSADRVLPQPDDGPVTVRVSDLLITCDYVAQDGDDQFVIATTRRLPCKPVR